MNDTSIGGRPVKVELAKKREALKQGERRGGPKRPALGDPAASDKPSAARPARTVEAIDGKQKHRSAAGAHAESGAESAPPEPAVPVDRSDKAAKKKLAKRMARVARKEAKVRRAKGTTAKVVEGVPDSSTPAVPTAAKSRTSLADDDAANKDGRLIVRNLSFHCTEDELRAAFGEYGIVSDVRIPKNADGRARGFGFVQFENRDAAQHVVEKSESLAIRGRPVAVDFSVSKTKYVEMQQAQQVDAAAVDNSTTTQLVEEWHQTKSAVSLNEPDDEADSDENEGEPDSPGGSGDDDTELTSSDDESDSDDEQGDNNDDDDDDGSDDNDDDGEGGLSGDLGAAKVHDSQPPAHRQPREAPRPQGVGLEHTVFCRNVLFETEESAIRAAFSKFGKIRSVKMVVDPVTQRPRGTAFVNFVSRDSVDAAIKEANAGESFHASKVLQESSVVSAAVKQGGIIVDGRRLLVTAAISRDDASKLKTVEPKAPQDTDKRNLYLAAEGVIREGDPAASFLTPAELALRANAERIKAQKLRDPSHFVSRTRLCVRNLPLSCDERQLKNVFLRSCEANPDRKKKVGKRIVSVFVVRDKASGRTVSGVARSRGYGFVNFAEHEDALFTLRALNNAQTTFEDRVPGALKALGAASAGRDGVEEPEEDRTARSTRRLVVEFAVENAKALNALEKRKQRADAAHIQSHPEARAGYGRGNAHGVSVEPDSAQPDQEKPKRTRKKRLSTKNRPNAAAKEASAAAAAEEQAVVVTAPAAQKRAKHTAAAVAADDQLASMDVEGERSADNPGKKRDRRGQKKQQRRDKEEEIALQDMIEQYKKKYY